MIANEPEARSGPEETRRRARPGLSDGPGPGPAQPEPENTSDKRNIQVKSDPSRPRGPGQQCFPCRLGILTPWPLSCHRVDIRA